MPPSLLVDVVASAALALAASIGWRRGAVPMALALAGLLGGYLGALIFARPAGDLLAAAAHLPLLVAVPLAGVLIMSVISMAVRLLSWRMRQARAAERAQGHEPSPGDRLGGAGIGIVIGAGVVILAAWAAGSAHALAGVGPDLAGSVTARVSARAVGATVRVIARRATGEPLLSSAMALMAADPRTGIAAVNRLAGDARLQTLWTDPDLRRAVMTGDRRTLAASPPVRAMAHDPAFVDAATRVGLLPEGGGADALAGRLVEQVGPMARTVQGLQRDPAMQSALERLDVQGRIERGDVAGLVMDPDFNRLSGQFLARLREEQAHAP